MIVRLSSTIIELNSTFDDLNHMEHNYSVAETRTDNYEAAQR